MSERDYAVVVDPARWSGDLEVLARRLGRSMQHRPDRLVEMMERGEVTVDADLRRQEAEMTCRRIARSDIPVSVRGPSGETVVNGEELLGDESPQRRERPAADSAADGVNERGEDSGAGGRSQSQDADPSGWGALLDGGEGSSAGAETAGGEPEDERDSGRESDASGAPALDELAGDSDSDGGPEIGVPTPGDGETGTSGGAEPLTLDSPAGDASGATDSATFPKDDSQPESSGSDLHPSAPEEESSGGNLGANVSSSGVEGEEMELGSGSADDDSSSPAPGGDAASDSAADFDGERMAEALSQSEKRTNKYANAFDDRAEHIPIFAALLSALAPGAGQLYNGDDDKASAFARRAILLKPWWESVRDAKEVGDAIHEGERPKPEEGNIRRALEHVGLMYGAFVALLAFLWFGVRVATDWGVQGGPEPTVGEKRRTAVSEASRAVQKGRIRAISRAQVARRDAGREEPGTSERRRAARLFQIGLEACRDHHYNECYETMNRVNELSDAFRRQAFQLSTWANYQAQPGSAGESMPDIDLFGARRAMRRAGLDVGIRRAKGDASAASRPDVGTETRPDAGGDVESGTGTATLPQQDAAGGPGASDTRARSPEEQ